MDAAVGGVVALLQQRCRYGRSGPRPAAAGAVVELERTLTEPFSNSVSQSQGSLSADARLHVQVISVDRRGILFVCHLFMPCLLITTQTYISLSYLGCVCDIVDAGMLHTQVSTPALIRFAALLLGQPKLGLRADPPAALLLMLLLLLYPAAAATAAVRCLMSPLLASQVLLAQPLQYWHHAC